MTNAEKYKTAKERSQAFNRFCNSHRKGLSWIPNCANCEFKDADDKCTFLWLAQEAPVEKPLPCPFCGCEPSIIKNNGYYNVECQNHDCRMNVYTVTCESKNKAIAIWNRRSK